MRALAAVASRHGLTTAIAERIAVFIPLELRERGVDAQVDASPRGGGDYARFGVAMRLMLRRGPGGLGW